MNIDYKELMNNDTDKQIALCIEKTGNDWNAVSDDKKYGRLFYRMSVNKVTPDGVEYNRNEWIAKSEQLTDESVRTNFLDYLNFENL